jgi:uncharacterized OsmC-like protein
MTGGNFLAPITVQSENGYRTAIHIRQHTIYADEHLDDGGTDTAPTPMEILTGMIGACIVVTTEAYAKRKNWPLEGVSVEVEMERIRKEDYPAYSGEAAFVHQVREKIRFDGPLSDEQRVRLMTIAGKCPVHVTLENPVFFVEKLVEETPFA